MLHQHHRRLPTLSDDALRRVPVLVALLLLVLLYVFGGTLTPSLSQTQPGQKKYISPWAQQRTGPEADKLTDVVLEQRAREYFAAWNKHDGVLLAQLFEERGTLQDWETVAHGRERVVEANTKIWAAVIRWPSASTTVWGSANVARQSKTLTPARDNVPR